MLGILCPGQGAQHAGMLDLLLADSHAAGVLDAVEPMFGAHPRILEADAPRLFDNDVAQPLICAAQGLRTVQAHRNPVRPELYVRTLRNQLAQTDVPALVWLSWMQHMGATLGQELGAVYASLCKSLRAHGVTQAAYSVTQTPDLSRPTPGSRDAAGLTLAQLRRLLAGELDEADCESKKRDHPDDRQKSENPDRQQSRFCLRQQKERCRRADQ